MREKLGHDFRYAARMLRKSPGFTLVGVLILALGIGANTAIFSIVDAVLLRPLPYPDPDRLVSIKADLAGLNVPNVGFSVPDLSDFRDAGVLDQLSASWPISANITGSDQPQRVEALAVTWNYFNILGANAALGRVFGAEDSAAGFAEGAVISDSLWKRMFGNDPKILGRKLRLDDDLYQIVGVLPPGFRHPGPTLQRDVEVWITSNFLASPFPNPPVRRARIIPAAIGRLKPGVAVGQAQAKLTALAAELSRLYPDAYPAAARWTPVVEELREDLVGKQRTMLLVILGAVGFVLLICSVSLANLLLARCSVRQQETAVRLALGASRSDLMRLLLSESLLLSLLGGAAGLITVIGLQPVLLRMAPAGMARLNEVGVSWTVLLFAAGISILTGLAFGLAPAVQLSKGSLVGALKEGSRGSSGQNHRFRSTLVACEVGLSLMLMAGAGLLLRSFWNLLDVDPGFRPQNVLVANIWLPAPNNRAAGAYYQASARSAFVREVMRRARTLPGVESTAMGAGNSIPLLGWNSANLQLEGRADDKAVTAQAASVSSTFFSTLGIRLVKGRLFTDGDDEPFGSVVIDESAARRFWPNEDPLFKRMKTARVPQARWLTVVGVVGDIKTGGLDAAHTPHLYIPIMQSSGLALTVFLKSASNPASLGEPLRREIQSIDHDLPVFGIQSMEQVIAGSLAQRRFALQMVLAFALVALALAAVGIHGVTAFMVSRRTREFGIRVALGARRADVIRLVLREGMQTTLWGLAGGLVGGLILTRFLRTMLFGATPADPMTFVAVSALLAGAALLACYLPALRATRIDPATALRIE